MVSLQEIGGHNFFHCQFPKFRNHPNKFRIRETKFFEKTEFLWKISVYRTKNEWKKKPGFFWQLGSRPIWKKAGFLAVHNFIVLYTGKIFNLHRRKK